MRSTTVTRKTAETDITLTLCLDGEGRAEVSTGCGFLDHMLTLLARHASFDLTLTCVGDTYVDDHHTVEDVGICLGRAFREALGDGCGITRYGSMMLPMDETLALCAVDISGRACLVYNLDIPAPRVGSFDTELVEEFFAAFVRSANLTLHVRKLDGRNSHHVIEGAFKAFARAMAQAVAIDPTRVGEIPSTKGVLL